MSAMYQTEVVNHDGGDGYTQILGGAKVPVTSPLSGGNDAEGTNPEQLLALAWATCLNATARVIVGNATRTAVRVEVELRPADPGPGYEFHVDAYLSVEGADTARTERVLHAAHARCPVSKLLRGAATARVHPEPYRVQA
ncbi:MAG TPA: OsmC family protein [Beutenbergiaceae bacterium]|nr:OsmC family protein [Beutenbergiaceae bacterium]